MPALVATVAVEKTYFNYESDYDYIVPGRLVSHACIGMRVTVSFGTGSAVRNGFIVKLTENENPGELKYINDITDDEVYPTEEMVSLALWLKDRTFSTTYDCLKAMLPRGLGEVKDATVKMVKLNESFTEKMPLTKKQGSVISVLESAGSASLKEVCTLAGVTSAVVDALVKKGAVSFYDDVIYRTPVKNLPESNTEDIALTHEQQKAYLSLKKSVNCGKGSTALLFGVTGSGKTQVFLKLIDDVLAQGKNVIVLVPEISLTPQTMEIFNNRYGSQIAVFHSALSLGQRSDAYKKVRSGKIKIVIGTRSAVFAPLENIGLIVMDEEQEHSYKSEQSPRYHARDVAKYRCAYNKALLLLASATPCIDSYSKALGGQYQLCTLENRYGNAVLPNVTVVDMKKEAGDGVKSALSGHLYNCLCKNLEKGLQSILLINRRGYNTFVACNSCGHVITCPNCSISLTYHSAKNRLICHYCGHSEPLRSDCPECGSEAVRYSGFGTQRIEEELAQKLPNARILRMDADTTAPRFSHEKKLNAFGRGEYDILLGTQMVAKGLDFPNVTLVGVVNADNSLYNENYDAGERAFSLLTQVVGRSGRGDIPGEAVIQTINPENPVIELSAKQDYNSFFETEIQLRRLMIYPPFCDIFAVGFSSVNENKACLCAGALFKDLIELNRKNNEKIIVLGPAPSKIAKINNKYRYTMLIKCKNTSSIRSMLHELLINNSKRKEFSAVTVYVDLNPDDLT